MWCGWLADVDEVRGATDGVEADLHSASVRLLLAVVAAVCGAEPP